MKGLEKIDYWLTINFYFFQGIESIHYKLTTLQIVSSELVVNQYLWNIISKLALERSLNGYYMVVLGGQSGGGGVLKCFDLTQYLRVSSKECSNISPFVWWTKKVFPMFCSFWVQSVFLERFLDWVEVMSSYLLYSTCNYWGNDSILTQYPLVRRISWLTTNSLQTTS